MNLKTIAAAAAFATATATATATAAGPADDLPPLNRAVVDFAKGQIGKSVGDGECTRLAAEALREAGAKRFPPSPEGDPVWGRPVSSFAEALPGDVLQFRGAVFAGRRSLGGGGAVTYRQEFPHHTAVVAAVRRGGSEVTILHQNVGTKSSRSRTVKKGSIRPGALQNEGHVWIYRPVAAEGRPTSKPEGPSRP